MNGWLIMSVITVVVSFVGILIAAVSPILFYAVAVLWTIGVYWVLIKANR